MGIGRVSSVGPNRLGLAQQPDRRPLGVAPMRTWHMLDDRGVPMLPGIADMTGDAIVLVKQLDSSSPIFALLWIVRAVLAWVWRPSAKLSSGTRLPEATLPVPWRDSYIPIRGPCR